MSKEERKVKKRKLNNFILPIEIVYEILLYLDETIDFISFSQINKYFYENLLIVDNIALNEIFKNNDIYLLDNLPHYLFKLPYLFVQENDNNNFNLLLKFYNLKKLIITGITDEQYFIFPKLEKLEELEIFFCDLSKNVFTNLHNLKKLEIDNSCSLLDDDLNFNNLINLKKLTFSCNKLIGDSLQNLMNLESLTIVNVKNINVLNSLINLKELTIGDIDECSFLQKLTNLEKLNIKSESLKDKDLIHLKKLKFLQFDTAINGYCLTQLPNLEEVTCSLENVENLNTLKAIKRLRLLNLSWKTSKTFTDNDLKQLPNIVELTLRWNKTISEGALKELVNLEKLNISYNNNFKDKDLINLKKLKYLNISNCENINGKCLQYFTELKEIDITGTNIKQEYLQKLKDKNPSIKIRNF
ncbi:hypothetical protein ABK040_005181 [Willaertia magna]